MIHLSLLFINTSFTNSFKLPFLLSNLNSVWITCFTCFQRLRFLSSFFFFFFFLSCTCFSFRGQVHCSRTVEHCSCTIHETQNYFIQEKNIKNGSYGTIHTFKNYFTTIFLVFSFQQNKLYLNRPLVSSER